jgi:hypothetical protein
MNVPNFCTATRALPVLLVLAPTSAFTAICASGGRAASTPDARSPRSVATGRLPRTWYGLPAHPVQREEPDET